MLAAATLFAACAANHPFDAAAPASDESDIGGDQSSENVADCAVDSRDGVFIGLHEFNAALAEGQTSIAITGSMQANPYYFVGCGMANRPLLPCANCGFSSCTAGQTSAGDLRITLGAAKMPNFGQVAIGMTDVPDSSEFQLGNGWFVESWEADVAAEIDSLTLPLASAAVRVRAVVQVGCSYGERMEYSFIQPDPVLMPLAVQQAEPHTFALQGNRYFLKISLHGHENTPPYHPTPFPPDHDITGACFAVGLEIQTLDGAHCGWAAKAWHVKPPPP